MTELRVTVRVSNSGFILCDYWPKVTRMTYARGRAIHESKLQAPLFERLKRQHNDRKTRELHG